MKTKNVYYSEKQAQHYRDINACGGMPKPFGGWIKITVGQIRLDDGRVITYTEISDRVPFHDGWGDAKLIGSIPYDGNFDYSRCTTKGYW